MLGKALSRLIVDGLLVYLGPKRAIYNVFNSPAAGGSCWLRRILTLYMTAVFNS